MSKKYTKNKFIKKAISIHGNRFDYFKVDYKGSENKVIITCKIHGDFSQLPASHVFGRGCPKCGINSRTHKRKHTTKWFVDVATKAHQNKYDYSGVDYINSHTKVLVACSIHGKFLQNPYVHLRGLGCPKCSRKYKPTTDEFIKNAKSIHGDTYDYSLVDYKSAFKSIEIICPIHGKFSQRPNTHLNGSGCLKCGLNRSITSHTKTLEKFVSEAKRVHGNLYDYSKSNYINNHTKIEIVCKKHGSFWQAPHMHLDRDKCGCPKCNMSQGEREIISYLDRNGVDYVVQKTFPGCTNPLTGHKLRYDFYIPSKNLLVEYDGNQHFTYGKKLGNYISTIKDLKDVQYRDKLKTKFAIEKDILLLRIKHTKLKSVNKILKSALK